jgi:hypothetical protein
VKEKKEQKKEQPKKQQDTGFKNRVVTYNNYYPDNSNAQE